MNSFLRILKEYLRWLWQGKFHVLSFLVITATFGYIFGIWNFYTKFVAAGFVSIGLFVILKQLMLDAKQFAEHKPNTVRNWISSLPRKRNIILGVGSATMQMMSGKVHSTISIPDNATPERKLSFLLEQVTHIQTALGKLDDRIDEVADSSKQASRQLEFKIENHEKALESLMAGHAVGAFDLSLFGIVITICGTLIQVFRV